MKKKDVTSLDLKKYERQGVDMSLLTASLSKTPTERAETNRAMLNFIEEVRKARINSKNADPQPRKIPQSA